MPIDINAILAPFQTPFTRQWIPITLVMERLAELVGERFRRASALERSTRAYPVIGFQDGAVMLSLSASQARALGPPPPDFTMIDAVRQELIIPRTVGVLADIVRALRESAEHFQTPTADMFRLDRPGRFVDVFGHAFLLARTIIGDFDPLAESLVSSARPVGSMLRALGITGEGRPPGAAEEPRPGAPAEEGGGLDDIVRWIAGGILIIPAFTSWLDALAREISIAVRLRLLTAFQGIEAQAFELRRSLLTDVLDTMRGVGQSAVEFLLVAQTILLSNIRYFGAFAAVYSGMLLFTLTRFSDAIRNQVNGILVIVNTIIDIINFILSIDLMPLLVGPIIGPIASRIGLPLPKFTIDDLLSVLTDVAGTAGSMALGQVETFLDIASRIARLVGATDIARKLSDVAGILHGARRHIVIPGQPAITRLTTRFPDIWALLVTPMRARWASALTLLRDSTGNLVEQVLFQSSDLLDRFAGTFEAAAGGATWLGGADLWRNLAATSDRLAFEGFGMQADERRAGLARDPNLPLGNAFDQAVARGGFHVVTSAIPAYIGGLIEFWRERRREREASGHGTSPHILARRARLHRVRVPRLTIRARVEGDLPAEGERRKELIATIAQRMRESVEQAWRTGELQSATAG